MKWKTRPLWRDLVNIVEWWPSIPVHLVPWQHPWSTTLPLRPPLVQWPGHSRYSSMDSSGSDKLYKGSAARTNPTVIGENLAEGGGDIATTCTVVAHFWQLFCRGKHSKEYTGEGRGRGQKDQPDTFTSFSYLSQSYSTIESTSLYSAHHQTHPCLLYTSDAADE